MEAKVETAVEPASGAGVRARARLALTGSRELIRIAYRDPEHVCERLTLYASHNLAEPSRAWADAAREAQPEVRSAELADRLRAHSAEIARIDGAVAGTPFFIALVPAYLAYLWQEARMTLRMASLYGHDPAALDTAAQMLALRGVHPTVEDAKAALIAVEQKPQPVPARRPLRTWIGSARALLVFGGFLSAPHAQAANDRGKLRALLAMAVAGAVWLTTWVVPVTFMVAMSWACEVHARQLGQRAFAFYDGSAATSQAAIDAGDRVEDAGHTRRQLVRSAVLVFSIAIPVGFVAYANHVRQSTGINWLGAIGALVALSLVIAASIAGSRR